MINIFKIIQMFRFNIEYNRNIWVKIKKGIHILAGFKYEILAMSEIIRAVHYRHARAAHYGR